MRSLVTSLLLNKKKNMTKYKKGELRSDETDPQTHENEEGVILGVDGGATSTVCICMPYFKLDNNNKLPEPLPVIGRAVAGCSNHNSVGETAARDTLEQVIDEALVKASSTRVAVRAVCLAVSGVDHRNDQERLLTWLRKMFSSLVKLYVFNDVVAALASGTMGKLDGCVLISGTGSISYGFTKNGKEHRAGGCGPLLGDWGSGFGIVNKALTAILKAHDGRDAETILTDRILPTLGLQSPDELIGWTYADTSWARIAALVPVVVSCAEAGDAIAGKVLVEAVEELAACVKAVVRRLNMCGEDNSGRFPVVLVGGVLEANKRWDIASETIECIRRVYPGADPIKPKVEPAVGAALLARNLFAREPSAGNGENSSVHPCSTAYDNRITQSRLKKKRKTIPCSTAYDNRIAQSRLKKKRKTNPCSTAYDNRVAQSRFKRKRKTN